MIGRVVLAALLAGIAAGLIMGAIQHVRLTPLILEAETYESRQHTQSHEATTAPGEASAPAVEEQGHDEGWAPGDGWQRTTATTITAAMTGAAFAAVLAGISLLTGLPVTRSNGLIWGLCGFLAVTLAPAAGLPPELPGMAAGDLVMRQIWWVGTIAATAAALYLIASRRETWAIALAVALIGLPHVIGAPVPITHESAVPPNLAATFAANSIAANAIFWSLIGLFLGMTLDRFAKDIYAT
jgi:cobalt transporter subunit CbtA